MHTVAAEHINLGSTRIETLPFTTTPSYVDFHDGLSLKTKRIHSQTTTSKPSTPSYKDIFITSDHKAKNIVENIVELLKNGNFNKVSYRPAFEGTVITRYMDYVALESRMSVAKGIMEALGDANINKIGVGKSTLMREIVRKVKEDKLYDVVAMAIVLESPNVRRIQREIVDTLGLKLDHDQTEKGRASHLQWSLSNDKEKKILVILDDIWKQLDLVEIRITPSERCKIVLTSRNRDVLTCRMGTQKDFALQTLLKEETWDLFEKMAGHESVKDPKLSYKSLEPQELKSLLLLCAQLPAFVCYRDLLKYCYVVRDFATIIASKDHNMFVMRNDGGLKAWPDAYSLKRYETFSILGGDIDQLPNEMECPQLRFFHVYFEDRSLQILNTLFQGMDKLNILDLTKMQLSIIPPSLLLLRNLQTLTTIIKHHRVTPKTTGIGEFKNLVVLSFLHSDIPKLPREIGSLLNQLARLWLLDLSNCSKLEMITPNVLSLVKLEELYIGNNFVQWEVEGLDDERKNDSLTELKHLSHLTILEIKIPYAKNLRKDLSKWIASASSILKNTKTQVEFKLSIQVLMKMLLKIMEDLHLDELNGVESVRISVIAFPTLETFVLKYIINLEEICHSKLPLTSFKNLRVLKMINREKLRYVFSSSMARGLPLLEGLVDVPKLVSFLSTKNSFTRDGGETIIEGNHYPSLPLLHDQLAFPNLKILHLDGLPKIKHVCSKDAQISFMFPNLQEIVLLITKVWSQKLTSLVVFPALIITSCLEQLKEIVIVDCGVEEIVATKREEAAVARSLAFPQITCQHLLQLSRLNGLTMECIFQNGQCWKSCWSLDVRKLSYWLPDL
ncbi:hypothetical protein I3760_08G167300 [Carya illinoinensis]|nr:hypothetical protein I3760_08G167300 [Carya illinoinensis]